MFKCSTRHLPASARLDGDGGPVRGVGGVDHLDRCPRLETALADDDDPFVALEALLVLDPAAVDQAGNDRALLGFVACDDEYRLPAVGIEDRVTRHLQRV